jgi:orotate phosphoribosyltransferase
MQSEPLVALLAERGALLEGHFRLSSGRHSSRFIQKFRILEDPALLVPLAERLVAMVAAFGPTLVVSAAVGGIVLGYEVARQLGTKAIFVEKEDGTPKLRRGFALDPGDRVLVVEDVVTTGGSVREVLDVVAATGARAVAVGVLVRRQPSDFGIPTIALLDFPVVSYEPPECPQCASAEPLTEPGSRYLNPKTTPA